MQRYRLIGGGRWAGSPAESMPPFAELVPLSTVNDRSAEKYAQQEKNWFLNEAHCK